MTRLSDRRGFLASLGLVGIATAGCLQSSQDDSQTTRPSSRSTESDTTTRPTEPETTAVDVSASMFDWEGELTAATGSQPAEVELTLTNTSVVELELTGGPAPPMSAAFSETKGSTTSTETDEQLVLYHPDSVDMGTPSSTSGGCWRGKPAVNTTALQPMGPARIVTLEPDDSVSETYDVYNHPENDACITRGDFVFESDLHRVRQNDSEISQDAPDLILRCILTVSDGRVSSVRTPEAELRSDS